MKWAAWTLNLEVILRCHNFFLTPDYRQAAQAARWAARWTRDWCTVEYFPNGIIEHCVQIHDKLTFLDINVDQKVISAASAPCVDLVGKKLEDVFPNDFTLQIVRNMCDEAKGFMDTSLVPRALPDKVAAFNEMPMFLGTRVVGVSGIMRVLLTEAGHFRVVLSFPWPKAANSVSL